MKRIYVLACLAVLGGFALAALSPRADAGQAAEQTTNSGPDPAIAREMGYRVLPNGAILYEELPEQADAQGLYDDIAPAAGESGAQGRGAQPSFRYDPLTQTFRRSVVDRQGKSRQDVINTNR